MQAELKNKGRILWVFFSEGTRKLLRCFILLVIMSGSLPALQAGNQPVNITLKARNQPLSEILEELTGRYGLKFAYDAEAFRKIRITATANNRPVSEVLNLLAREGHVRFRLMEGTWIAVVQPVEKSDENMAVKDQVIPAKQMVTGYVTDGKSGEPLAYCNLVTEAQRGTVTNEAGFFRVEADQLPLRLYISHLGYKRLDTVIVSNAGSPLQFRLEPFAVLMEEVNIARKEKSLLEMGEYSEKIGFNPTRSAAIPRLSHDDLVNMLTMIPGVSFLNGYGGGLSIRGGNPSENLVLLDGIPILETGHMLGNVSVLNASYIRQAFVSRGGFDVSQGDRTAGVVELTGKSGSLTRPNVDASVNLLNGNLQASIPVARKLTISGAWRRSFIDQWQNYLSARLLEESHITPADEVPAQVQPVVQYEDINLRVTIYPSDNQTIHFGYLNGADFQMMDYEIGDRLLVYRNEYVTATNRGYSASWALHNPKWSHGFTAGYTTLNQYLEFESGRQTAATPGNQKPRNPKAKEKPVNTNRNKYELDIDSISVTELRAEWKSELQTGIFSHQAGWGLVANQSAYRYHAERSEGNTPVDSMASSRNRNLGHLYLQEVIEPNRMLKLKAGLRINLDPVTRQLFWQPRAGAEMIPAEGLKLYVNSGIYRQFITKVPRIDINGNVDWIWLLPGGNGDVTLKAIQHLAGFKLERGGWLINAEAYSRHTSGRQWLFAENYRKGSVSRIQYVSYYGEERNLGMDLFGQYRHRFFTHQAAFSVSGSREKVEGIYGGNYFPGLNEPAQQLRLNEIFAYKGWIASASWTYRNGQTILMTDGSGNLSFPKLDYFSQFDAGIVKSIRLAGGSLSAGVSLLNIFNRLNVVQVNVLNIQTEGSSYNIQSNTGSLAFTPVFFLRFQVL